MAVPTVRVGQRKGRATWQEQQRGWPCNCLEMKARVTASFNPNEPAQPSSLPIAGLTPDANSSKSPATAPPRSPKTGSSGSPSFTRLNRGLPSEVRLAIRHDRSASKIADFEIWLTHHRARVSAKSRLGEALKYIAKYRMDLCLFLTDGRIEMDNNTVERTIRPIPLNRKNALFAGHDAGAENWATIASLVETCKLNSIEPHAYLTAKLTAIVQGHKQSQIDALLPWN